MAVCKQNADFLKRRFKIYLSVSAAIILQSCVTIPENNYDAPTVEATTTVTTDHHRGAIKYSGPELKFLENGGSNYFFLRGWKSIKGDKPLAYQIYYSSKTTDWMFYDAAFSEGESLPIIKIDNAIRQCSPYGCVVQETVGINITAKQYQKYLSTGFKGILSSKRGDIHVLIPDSYFQGFNAKMHRQN